MLTHASLEPRPREPLGGPDEQAAQPRVAVFGVASEQSIAWHIARELMQRRFSVHIAYQQRFRSRVLPLVKASGAALAGAHRCDLKAEEDIETFVRSVGAPLHGIVHSVAFAPPETFGKGIDELDCAEFAETLHVSCFSLLNLIKHLRPHLAPGGSVVTMTYIGAQRVVPGYGIMGIAKAALEAAVRQLAVELGPQDIRVNAVSAGPIRTLSALAVPRIEQMLERYASIAPLRRCVSGEDIAQTIRFLLSPASSAITGQTIFVDAGFSAMAMPMEDGQ